MCICAGSTKSLASIRCWASDGRATIGLRAGAPAAVATPAAEAPRAALGVAVVGVVAATSTGGGATGVLARPSTPPSAATSTATPTAAITQANSHAPRSDGGDGGAANGAGADTATHPTRTPSRSCTYRVTAHMRTPTIFIATLAAVACCGDAAVAAEPRYASLPEHTS